MLNIRFATNQVCSEPAPLVGKIYFQNMSNVLPEMFDYILKIGKDNNKFSDDKSLLEHLFKTNKVYDDYTNILSNDRIPAVGIKQIDTQTLCQFEKKARREVACYKIKKQRKRRKKS